MNTPNCRHIPLTPYSDSQSTCSASPGAPFPLPRLDARLSAALPLVRGGIIADVGTDHAYLPLVLLAQQRCSFAVATDIHLQPAQRAAATLSRYGVDDRRAAVLCTDGLHGCEAFHPTDILIFGMGGEMIVHILSEAPFVRDPSIRLILQPMTRQSDLRAYLCQEGFCIKEETMVQTDRIYQVLCAEYDGTVRHLSPLALLLGEHNLARRDPVTLQEAERRRDILCVARQGKRKSAHADTSSEDALITALSDYLEASRKDVPLSRAST